MVFRMTLNLTFILPFRVPFRVSAFQLSRSPAERFVEVTLNESHTNDLAVCTHCSTILTNDSVLAVWQCKFNKHGNVENYFQSCFESVISIKRYLLSNIGTM